MSVYEHKKIRPIFGTNVAAVPPICPPEQGTLFGAQTRAGAVTGAPGIAYWQKTFGMRLRGDTLVPDSRRAHTSSRLAVGAYGQAVPIAAFQYALIISYFADM